MKLFWFTQLLFLCSVSDAFSGSGRNNSNMIAAATSHQLQEGAAHEDMITNLHLATCMMLACWHPLEASAAPFNDLPLLPNPTLSKITANSGYSLSDTVAFKLLPRQPILSGAVKELRDLQDLQDDRLAACADKGSMWEQCFMFGRGEGVEVGGADRGRMDSQLISPVGSLNPPEDAKKIPTW